jgi:hypothetical protein
MGCTIEIERELGFTKDFREKRGWQDTHFLIAKVIGEKGTPETTQKDEQGIQAFWYTLPEAIAILEKEVIELPYEAYNSCFNVRTHLAALRKLI